MKRCQICLYREWVTLLDMRAKLYVLVPLASFVAQV